ncbi:hypothetical protein SBA2_260094 [Acidobacteriia bacterium SbA2]|nr:hypothetical protein SBA2_260094 [Acidobacteriia bacterium SbA2]
MMSRKLKRVELRWGCPYVFAILVAPPMPLLVKSHATMGIRLIRGPRRLFPNLAGC